MKTQTLIASLLLSMGCTPDPQASDEALPLLGGYRDPADQCQRVGESARTIDYLDHTADLVACPVDYEGRGVFVTETGATEVARIMGHVLFSVSQG